MTDRPYEMRALDAAAYAGDLEAVRQYVVEGGDLEAIASGWDGNRTVLGIAAYKGYVEMVRFLLAHGADPNGPKQGGRKSLENALWSANVEIVRMLLDHGAEVNATDEHGNHALIEVASWNRIRPECDWISIARLLIAAGSNLNHANSNGMTPLKLAVWHESSDEPSLEVARILLEAGAEVDTMVDEEDWTALMYAVSEGNLGAVRLLVEAGANVNQADDNGDTAWNQALRWGYPEIATLLERAGAIDVDEAGLNLHQAILWGKTDVVSHLLEQSTDANAQNRRGQPALLAAIENWGKEEIVRLLLDHGADIHAGGEYEQTPLMVAVQSGRPRRDQRAIVQLLIERGAEVSASQNYETNVLLLAAEGEPEIVRLLLNAGAEVDAGNWEGTTALIDADRFGNLGVVALLLERGANINARTLTIPESGYYGGITPLIRAVQGGHLEVVRLLLDHGAEINAQDDADTSALMWSLSWIEFKSDSPQDSQNSIAIVRLLLERGVDVNLRDLHGRTALDETPRDTALQGGRAEVVRLLEQAGAIRCEPTGPQYAYFMIEGDPGRGD